VVNLNTFFHSIPQFGNDLISNIYDRYAQWAGRIEIPAFQCTDGSLVFRQGKILLNKESIESLLDRPRAGLDMGFWLGMSGLLSGYRSWYFKEVRRRKTIEDLSEAEVLELDEVAGDFEMVFHGLMAKVYRKLKRRYDETTDGLSFHLDEEGELAINGMKVGVFLDMASRYPTEKSRTFLKGLRNRLAVILANRNGNPNYDKIRESSMALFSEIDGMLAKKPRLHLLSDAHP